MPKFFVDQKNICGDKINITGEDVTHIKKVLRLRCGDNIIVCDCKGRDYTANVSDIGADFVYADIVSVAPNDTEPKVNITLYQGMPKSDKMDLVVQKSVELGVASIIPVITERTVVRINGENDAKRKQDRWQKIALEAAKQSNRGRIPNIGKPIEFTAVMDLVDSFDVVLVPYEKESAHHLGEYINIDRRNISNIAVIIGPEGGFTEQEIFLAQKNNTKIISLGRRILRTETAGIVALSIIMYQLGEI